MTRRKFHSEVDELLNRLGFSDEIVMSWGSFVIEVKFENGREILKIKERETIKEVK